MKGASYIMKVRVHYLLDHCGPTNRFNAYNIIHIGQVVGGSIFSVIEASNITRRLGEILIATRWSQDIRITVMA